MREAVSDILIDRARDTEGIGKTVLLSLGAHVLLIVLLVVMPAQWRRSETPPAHTMTISLGGTPGPRQGMTPMAGRAVQKVAPLPPKTAPVVPPAARKPEVVEPLPNAKPARKTPEKVEKPSKPAPMQKPTVGPEIKSGAAHAETQGQAIPFGGLATGGSGAGGYLDVKDFCCPEYLTTMVGLIQRHWQSQQNQNGQVVVKFTIQRDGTLTGVQVEKPSSYFLNMAAQRAVIETHQLPPLPTQFPEDHLTVHLIFQYQR
ncbi:MAG TPA: TonB family protein [Vicinamibacterales bacterium]|nr:TonB family protein [Vicinamibacterales bacterium]